jgi:hypothetical protein
VYLCAGVPDIGRSVFHQWRDDPDMLNPVYVKGLKPDAQIRTTSVDLELARALLCADRDEPTAQAALNRLRPQARYPSTVPFPLSEFPTVSCTSVVCTGDQFIGPDWSRRVARDRLGAELIELPGSHSPFLSRSKALADVLLPFGCVTHDVGLSLLSPSAFQFGSGGCPKVFQRRPAP